MKKDSRKEIIYIQPQSEYLVISQDARICDTSMEDYEIGEDQEIDWDS